MSINKSIQKKSLELNTLFREARTQGLYVKISTQSQTIAKDCDLNCEYYPEIKVSIFRDYDQ